MRSAASPRTAASLPSSSARTPCPTPSWRFATSRSAVSLAAARSRSLRVSVSACSAPSRAALAGPCSASSAARRAAICSRSAFSRSRVSLAVAPSRSISPMRRSMDRASPRSLADRSSASLSRRATPALVASAVASARSACSDASRCPRSSASTEARWSRTSRSRSSAMARRSISSASEAATASSSLASASRSVASVRLLASTSSSSRFASTSRRCPAARWSRTRCSSASTRRTSLSAAKAWFCARSRVVSAANTCPRSPSPSASTRSSAACVPSSFALAVVCAARVASPWADSVVNRWLARKSSSSRCSALSWR